MESCSPVAGFKGRLQVPVVEWRSYEFSFGGSSDGADPGEQDDERARDSHYQRSADERCRIADRCGKRADDGVPGGMTTREMSQS